MASRTDRELLDDFRRHQDQQAFALLVERHAGWVYGLCLRVTGRAIEAEEACSDAFFELARAANQVRERLPAWLHTVARRQAARVISRRSGSVPPSSQLAQLPSERADIEHLDEALDELPAELRAVLVLRFLANISQEQISQQLNLSQPTVSRRIAQALAAMRSALDRRGASLGVLPAALFQQLPGTAMPAHAVDALRRVALVVRPLHGATRLAWLSVPNSVLAGALLLASGAATVVWHRSPPAAAAGAAAAPAVADAASGPGPARPAAVGLLGWTDRIVYIAPADTALRAAVGTSRTILAIDDQPVVRWELAGLPILPGVPIALTVLDPDGRVRRIPGVMAGHLGTALAWDPRGGVAAGSWDGAVARAASCWRDLPQQALAAIAAAQAQGCPVGELAVLATAAAAESDQPDLAATWQARVPAARGDRWMADCALQGVLRAHGRLAAARAPLAHLTSGVGRLPEGLADVTAAPAFPAAWQPLLGLGAEFSYGSAHLWDALHEELASPTLGAQVAVEARGDIFTAVPGLARDPDLSGIYLRPLFADGHRADIRDCVGVLGTEAGISHVCDGSGALIQRLPQGSGAIDLRALVTDAVCAVWVDGRLCALAPNRHQGPWQLVVGGVSCDIYLPHLRISTPDAPPRDDLPSAIVADDPAAVQRRLAAGDDPQKPFADSREAPLAIAASADATQAITALLADARVSVADRDQTQATALYRAVDNHACAAARLLAGRGAAISALNRYGTTPLGYACRSRNLQLVELLLDHGALTAIDRPNATPAGPALDLMAPGRGAAAIIAAFRSRHVALTPRALAISGDDPGALALLAAEADPEVRAHRGAALLAVAVLLDDRGLMEACLRCGITAGGQDPGTGMTAVQLAIVVTGNLTLALELVAHGANPAADCKYGSMRDLSKDNGFPLDRLLVAAPAPAHGF